MCDMEWVSNAQLLKYFVELLILATIFLLIRLNNVEL